MLTAVAPVTEDVGGNVNVLAAALEDENEDRLRFHDDEEWDGSFTSRGVAVAVVVVAPPTANGGAVDRPGVVVVAVGSVGRLLDAKSCQFSVMLGNTVDEINVRGSL